MANEPKPRQVAAGSEALLVVQHTTNNVLDQNLMIDEALEIYRRCPPPLCEAVSTTGLIIGLVQAGKTANFETVMALARDEGYRMVILVGGSSVPLFDQSNAALSNALRLDSRDDRPWLMLSNPTVNDLATVRSALDAWRVPKLAHAAKQTVLLTVMKHAGRIAKLNELLAELDLDGISVLVFDDEADQAGLNTKVRQGEVSATYGEIKELRGNLPAHAFLQYTATPQALLLISIVDELSPDFVRVLTPGTDYIGGREFFGSDVRSHVRMIPVAEVPTATNQLKSIPESLLMALCSFFIVVALGYHENETGGKHNRSMMVHPSRLVEDHGNYFDWISDTKEEWTDLLAGKPTPERAALITRFQKAHVDLLKTHPSLPPFGDLEPLLATAVSRTAVHEMNAPAGNGKTPQILWRNHYSHILVGGQAMDRGFVVRDLITTYMPRGLGLGHADALQQRARFFGYKRDVFGLCRVFLEKQTIDAYAEYVKHEEDVRGKLLKLQSGDHGLKEWRREFILTMLLRPTRQYVLIDPYAHMAITTKWTTTHYPWLAPIDENRHAAEDYLAYLHSAEHPDFRQDWYRDRPLREVVEEFLINLRWAAPVDAESFTAALARMEAMLNVDEEELADIFFMRGRERRGSSALKGVNQLMQGPSGRYLGDRQVFVSDRVSIQVHITSFDETENGKRTVLGAHALALAIRFPERATTGVILKKKSGKPGVAS